MAQILATIMIVDTRNSNPLHMIESSSSQMSDLCGPVPILLAITEMEVATKRSKGNVAFWRLHNSIHIKAYNRQVKNNYLLQR